MGRFVAAVCLALGLVAVCNGQIPTYEECDETFDRLGEDSLQSTFTPCALGSSPSASCCSAIASTTGLSGGGELAGCLCQQQVIDGFVGVLEQNTLAKAVGFNGAKLSSVLSQCGADFVGNNGCNVPGPTPTPTSTPTEGSTSPTPTPSSPPSLLSPTKTASPTKVPAPGSGSGDLIVTAPSGAQYVIQNADPNAKYEIIEVPGTTTVAASGHSISGIAGRIPMLGSLLGNLGRR